MGEERGYKHTHTLMNAYTIHTKTHTETYTTHTYNNANTHRHMRTRTPAHTHTHTVSAAHPDASWPPAQTMASVSGDAAHTRSLSAPGSV